MTLHRGAILPTVAAAWLGLAGALAAAPAPEPSGVLARKMDLDFEKTSLDNVLTYLEQVVPGLRIVVDADVRTAAINLSARVVDLKVRQVPLDAVLDVVLGPDLAYVAEAGSIHVTTRLRLWLARSSVAYPVEGIIRHLSSAEECAPGLLTAAPPQSEAAAEERRYIAARILVSIIRGVVNQVSDPEVAPWADEGGTADASCVGGRLVVTQTAAGQRCAAEALETLRKALDLGAELAKARRPAAEQPVVAPPERAGVAEARFGLDQPVDLELEKTGLDNVLKYLGEAQRGLNLVVDPAVAAGGIDLASRFVTLKCKRLPVRSVLSLVLGTDLDFVLGPGYVMVTTRGKSLRRLAARAYPVADLVKAAADEEQWPEPGEDLVNLMRWMVSNQVDSAVAPWADEGGPAVVEYAGSILVVTQTARGHARTLDLLNRIRSALSPAPAGARAVRLADPQTERVAETRRRLDETIDLDFEQTSLENVLRYLAEVRPDLNLVIDPAIAEAGIDLSTRVVTLRLRQAPVAAALDILLAPDLGYRVEPGYVYVAERRTLGPDLTVTMYPLADVVKALGRTAVWRTWQDLVDAIRRTVNHWRDLGVAAWTAEGGYAWLGYYAGVLIVGQSERGHARLAALLETLRAALAWQERQTEGVTAAVQCVFAAADPEAEAAGRLLRAPVDVALYGQPLDGAIRLLSGQRPGVNVVLDPRVREAGIDPAAWRVMIERGRQTLGELLPSILPPTMYVCARPGYLLVTTCERAEENLPLALYPIQDLLNRDLRRRGKALAEVTSDDFDAVFKELADGMRRTVNRRSDPGVTEWVGEGGRAIMEQLGDVLLVTQTPRGHEQVLKCLNDVRAGR